MPRKSPIRKMAESTRRATPPDETASSELLLYAENTGELYNQRKAIIANLTKKIEKGVYDKSKAPTIWLHWLDIAAKRYQREFGSGSQIFSAATRRHAAQELAKQEEAAIRRGEYK